MSIYDPPDIDGWVSDTIPPSYATYVGEHFAFSASGGFELEQGLRTVELRPYEAIYQYDMTNAVQLFFDVRTFNDKLGITKDASNLNVILSTYDASGDEYAINDITINATEFNTGIPNNGSSIIDLGQLETLYSSFTTFLCEYFGFPTGFTSLFTVQSQIEMNNGVFNNDSFLNLMSSSTLNNVGEYILDMSGAITISELTTIMRFITYYNPFGNRDPSRGTAGISSDVTNRSNYTLADGFLEDDVIFIPSGIKVTLSVDIENNNVLITNAGTGNLPEITHDVDFSGNFSQVTTVQATNITRVVTIPLMLRLRNLSTSNEIPEGTIVTFDTTLGWEFTLDPTDYNEADTIQNILAAYAAVVGLSISDLQFVSYTITESTREFIISNGERTLMNIMGSREITGKREPILYSNVNTQNTRQLGSFNIIQKTRTLSEK